MAEPTRPFYDWMNTDLSAITTLQDADHVYVRDDSASGNAKITFANLKTELHKAPGAIGGTTPAAGSFTTLSASTDPSDGDGVGNRDYNDARYVAKDLYVGTDAFAGSTGTTITHNHGSTNYKFVIHPVADPGGYLGEVYLAIAANTTVVYNSGSAVTNFDYAVLPIS